MIELSDKEFETIVSRAIDAIPDKYFQNLKNVAFVIEEEPTPEQRQKLGLRCEQTLFGLYEGIPLTRRGAGYNLVLPDKITIFKNPALAFSHNMQDLVKNVKNTVWHEVAHYFGLDHDRIHQLEQS